MVIYADVKPTDERPTPPRRRRAASTSFDELYRSRKVGTPDARELIDFANLTLTAEVWARLVAGSGVLYEVKDAGDGETERGTSFDLSHALWDQEWCKRERAYDEARALQREVRDVLDAVVRRDHATVEDFINRGGPFHCRITPPSAAQIASTDKTPSEADSNWRLRWVPTRSRGLLAGAVHALRELLDDAPQLARCELERCGRFFLRDTRWANRPRRFCEDRRCSFTAHNAARLASGYFANRRRAKRAAPR